MHSHTISSSSYKLKACFYQNHKEFLRDSPLPTNLIFAIPASLLFKKELPLRISAGGCVTAIVKTYKAIYSSDKCILLQSKFQVRKTSFLKGGAVTKFKTTKKEIFTCPALTRAHVVLPLIQQVPTQDLIFC